jgi:YidC/Oxa1 family membrane protein insertase
MNRLALLLLLLCLPALLGCFGQSARPLDPERLPNLQMQLEEMDRKSEAELKDRIRSLHDEVARTKDSKDGALRAEAAHNELLLAYCWERLGQFSDAKRFYHEAAASEFGSVAYFRIAQVAEYQTKQYLEQTNDPDLSSDRRQEAAALSKQTRKQAVQALERCTMFPVGSRGLLRRPEVASLLPGFWSSTDLRHEAYRRLDAYYRDTASYQVFQFLVRICGGLQRSSSYALALLLLAVLAKLITTPLSLTQFRSLRAMQAIQPELKKIQEKYKSDKATLAKAQMALFKEHGVNPASSCLPMLIQLPILMWVYWGIRHFTYQFMGKPFLYLSSLGDPDVLHIGDALWPGPLILLYGLSMYFSQKLIATPAATPEQQQQQKLMAYMMPVLFIFIMKGLPAAFIFYWLAMNILMTGHQYLIMRPQRLAAAVAEDAADRPGPPPPEAIRKLSEGTKPRPKKKRRR